MILEPAPNGFTSPDDPGDVLNPGGKRWSVSTVEARILSALFRGLEVLEIGTGLGVSTKALASTAEWVYTVDNDPWVRDTVARTLPENVDFFTDISKVPIHLGGAFIDGDHTYEMCMKDIRDCMAIVNTGGLLVFHDAGQSQVMKAVLDSHLNPILIVTGAGMMMTWNELVDKPVRLLHENRKI
jgi:hypothetical protein